MTFEQLKSEISNTLSVAKTRKATLESILFLITDYFNDFPALNENIRALRDEVIGAKEIVIPASLLANQSEIAAKASEVKAKQYLDAMYEDTERIGTYNAATGVYTISETGVTGNVVAVPQIAKGKYFDVIAIGTNNIPATGTNWGLQDKLISAGTKWDRIPFGLGEKSVKKNNLATDVANMLPNTTEFKNKYTPLWRTRSKKGLIWCDHQGNIYGKFLLRDGSVKLDSLDEEIVQSLVKNVSLTVRRKIPIATSRNKRLLFWTNKKGELFGNFVQPKNSVTSEMLSDDVANKILTDSEKRVLASNPNDVTIDTADDWRAQEIEVPVSTDTSGIAYTQFSPVKTSLLKGVNNTGTSLTFVRQSIQIHGKRYRGDLNGAQPTGTHQEGDFWNIVSDGVYGTISLKAGERLIFLGLNPSAPIFVGSAKGEFFFMGETASLPASPKSGDVYAISTTGVYAGINMVDGDLIAFNGGWGQVSKDITVIPSGNSFYLQCNNASDWAVRKTDKTVVPVSVYAKGMQATVRRLANENYVFWGDSMPGYEGLGNALLTAMQVTGNVASYSGAKSNQIVGLMRKEIRGADTYAGRTMLIWHGHNNSTDTVQQKDASYKIAALAGVSTKRFCFWSMAGQRAATWNGTRFVFPSMEQHAAKTGMYYEMEEFYRTSFPKQFFNTREALISSAATRNVPDPQFPGMTEAQVAATYGIIPFSYWFRWLGKPFTAEQLVFKGYRVNMSGLTGGVHGDYYLRTETDIGNLMVNVNGVWTEYNYASGYDTLHFNPVGRDALVAQFKIFNSNAKI